MNYNQIKRISDIEVSEQDCRLAIKHWVDKNSKMKDTIPNINKILTVFESKQYLGRLVFHGGCLGCQTPLIASVGVCRHCQYYEANWSVADLSFRV